MAKAAFNPYTRRQTMVEQDYEIYRYRSTYMNEVDLHHHDFYEIYLLLRGRVEYIVENRIFRMRPGDWMLVSPLELHQARIGADDAYERIVLWVARPYLERLSSARTSLTRCFDTTVPGHTNLLRLPGASSAAIRQKLETLGELHAREGYGDDLLATGCLVSLLVELNRAAADRRGHSCFVCESLETNMRHLSETVIKLWQNEPEFRELYAAQTHICLPHYSFILSAAQKMPKKNFIPFAAETKRLAKSYLDTVQADTTHFCRMFDYRNKDGDWGNSRDAIERSITYITGRVPSVTTKTEGKNR